MAHIVTNLTQTFRCVLSILLLWLSFHFQAIPTYAAYQATIVFYGNLLDFYMPRNLHLHSGIQHYRQVRLITGHKMIFSVKMVSPVVQSSE